MAKGREWDLTSTSSVTAAAEWMRTRAGAQLVLVVRPGDIAFAVDPQIAPTAARDMVELVMPEVQVQLEQQRAEKRRKRTKGEPELPDAQWNEMRRERGL